MTRAKESLLLRTAYGLHKEGEVRDDMGAFDVWLEDLSHAERVDLWAQVIEDTLELLYRLAEIYYPEEVSDVESP